MNDKTAYRDGTTHVVFERGGLPPLDFMAKLAALVPKARTNLTGPPTDDLNGVLAPNSRYRESVTPHSVRKVEPASADVEADGPDEPGLRAGRRKGLCWAMRLKRVFNIDVSVCSACGGPMKIIAESRTTASKIRRSLAIYCRTLKPQAAPYRQAQQRVLLEHARRRQGVARPHKSHECSMDTAQGKRGG